jgi:hypothetical protein
MTWKSFCGRLVLYRTRTAGRKLEKWGMSWTGILQLNFTISHWDLASAFGCAWVLSVTYLLPDDLLYCLTPVTSSSYTKSTRFRQKPTDMKQRTWTNEHEPNNMQCTKRIKKDQTGPDIPIWPSWTRDDPSAAPGILTFNHRRKAMGTSSLEVAHCEGSMVLRSQSPHVAKTYLTRLTRSDSTDSCGWLLCRKSARVMEKGHYATLVL